MASREKPHLVEFGILVRQRREARGWSQESLAAEALNNVNRKSTVSQVENGKANITPETARKFARALDIEDEVIPGALRWPEAAEVVENTNTVVHRMDRKLDAILRFTAESQSVPLSALRAILGVMGEIAGALDAGEIEERLKAKAVEFQALTGRLHRLSNSDPQVQRLRQAAADALSIGHFEEADALLAKAEARDLVGIKDLEALAHQKRLSAAENRAERGAAARLRATRDGYLEAANHYEVAARLAAPADPSIARSYLALKGQALVDLGDEFGLNSALNEAVDHYQSMLAETDCHSASLDWAKIQNSLGAALWRLGERETDTKRFEEAVAACRSALNKMERERVPLDWARTQNNLGLALWRLGERETGTGRFEEAILAYRSALEELTRDRFPLDWARTQNILGLALWRLGERESGTKRLEEARAAYEAALTERTRERFPLDWARTQNNLGLVLWRLGERKPDTKLLEAAVCACHAALKERTRSRVPLQWAMTQHNLGLALWRLGEQEAGTKRLEEARAAYEAALTERTRERVPLDWARTQNCLGLVLWRLGEREASKQRLTEALAAYKAALLERTRERHPLDWSQTQANIELVLRSLGELGTCEK